MTDSVAAASSNGGDGPQPVPAQPAAQEVAASAAAQAGSRPELPVIGAFAGGFALAMILRRLARSR